MLWNVFLLVQCPIRDPDPKPWGWNSCLQRQPYSVYGTDGGLVVKSCLTLASQTHVVAHKAPLSSAHGIFQSRILEWVAISFSRGFSLSRDRTRLSCIVGGFFTNWGTRKAQLKAKSYPNQSGFMRNSNKILEKGPEISKWHFRHLFIIIT